MEANLSLYEGVIKECEFCREHWPVVEHEGKFYHVGPYSKRLDPFKILCRADQVRRLMNYKGYEGAEIPVLTVPVVSTLNPHYFKPKTRDFFRHMSVASIRVASWPAWKRGCDFDGKVVTEEENTASAERARRDIRIFDAYEYYAFQPCSENQVYRPKVTGAGAINKPTCNEGVGCTACWLRYQAAEDKYENDHPCPL